MSDKEGTQSYALLLTMPAYRTRAAADSEVRFLETPAGAPRAIDAWWYVGETTGYEFMYSKAQLAALNSVGQPEPVAAGDARGIAEGDRAAIPPIANDPHAPDIVNGNGVPAETSDEHAADAAIAAAAEQQEVELRAQAQPPAPQPPFENEPAAADRNELPQTASPLALILLTGLVSGGLGLRLLRK